MIRVPRLVGLAALVVPAFGALAMSLAHGPGDSTLAAGAPDAIGLSITTLLVDLSAAGLIGALVLCTLVFAGQSPAFARGLDVASGSAALLTIAAAATGFLHERAVAPRTVILSEDYGTKLWAFATENPVGQAWLATTLIAAVLTVVCFAVRSQTAIAVVTVGAMLGLIPLALQGQATDTPGYDISAGALYLCVVFAAGWVGGLLTLILCRNQLDDDRLIAVIRRYSTLALGCFVVVLGSGLVSAGLRLGSWANLMTGYGILVLVTALAVVVLGFFAVVRWRSFARNATGRALWVLITVELAVMGIAEGIAAALAAAPAPRILVPADRLPNPTPAELLTGAHLPAAPTLESYLTGLNPDPGWILACALGLLCYLVGVRRLRQRGERWPIRRTVSWIVGMLVLFYVTSGGVDVYAKYLFSAQVIAHLALLLVVPVLLVLAAPVGLACHTVAPRDDGSRGAREWMLLLVRSRAIRFLGGPIVAAVLLVASLWAVYYTPVLSWATTDPVGHEWMTGYLLFVGWLFVRSISRAGPGAGADRESVSYRARLLILFATVLLVAVFAFVLSTGTELLSANWYGAMGWGSSIPALADQQLGGRLAWVLWGVFALALGLTMSWQRRAVRSTPP